MLRKLTKKEGDRFVHWGGWIGYWYSGKTEIRLGDFGGGAVDPEDWTRCALGEEPAQDALEWLRMVMWDEEVVLRPDMVESFGMVTNFAPGKVATCEEGSWVLQSVVDAEPQHNWDVGPLPKGPAGHVTINTTDGWAIWKGTKNPEAAWELMKFLITPTYIKAMASAQGLQPARKSVLPDWFAVMREAFPPLEDVRLEMWGEAMDKNLGIIWPYFPDHSAAKEIIGPAYDSVFVTGDEGVEAIARAAEEVTAKERELFPELQGQKPPYVTKNW
jgi:multiple sugar transport system substrate-binding protein